MDVKVPNMLYANLARSPVFGGRIVSFDASEAKAVPGVRDVVKIRGNKIAVVADNTWAAIRGRKALSIVWDEGKNSSRSSSDVRQGFVAQAAEDRAEAVASEDSGATTLEAAYDVPYLAHATMEPMNCVADVRSESCDVWVATQDPQGALTMASDITRVSRDATVVHIPLAGGGFGRRSELDYLEEALRVSKAVGAPIQVVWTREEDIRNGSYHPLSHHRARARLDEPDHVEVRDYRAGRWGLVPTTIFRSVVSITEAYVRECFLDELAVATGADPCQLRMDLGSLSEPQKAVIELAAEKAGWGAPLPDGWGRGIAFHSTWGVTHVAEVVEVSVAADGAPLVHRVVCAIDCGTVVNPDMVENQMEGGIAFALSYALKGEITIEDGRVQQSNYHDYPILRFREMPVVEVHIVPSDRPPQGVGEMAVPPLAPAVANAIYAATGKRIRRLPIRNLLSTAVAGQRMGGRES
jgi:isoquinoline 1-oxidoreductase beta subunit